MESRFLRWHERSVELVVVDLNPQSGKKAWVAREKEPLPLIINAEAGAIINSVRSALDLLGAALAKRNAVTPSKDTHFPIFNSLHDFIDPLHGIEGKKWLSKSDLRIIKSLKPYEGGNDFLWPLHQLDIMRKHERLIAVAIQPLIVSIFLDDMTANQAIMKWQRMKQQTILIELPADAPDPQIQLSLDIKFDETPIGLSNAPVVQTLRGFAAKVENVIGLFDN